MNLLTNDYNMDTLKFYKSAKEPTDPPLGLVWFDLTDNMIKLRIDDAWCQFGTNNRILTQAQYDALTTKDNTCIYFIKDA